MVTFDSHDVKLPKEASAISELSGSMKKDDSEEKLMHSVLEAGDEEQEYGRMIVESINQGVGSFSPETMFRNLVNNYRMAEKIYGETMIRQLSGYDPSYVKKNVNIPEFRNELQGNIQRRVDDLKEKGMIDKHGSITQEGIRLSSIIMYMDELEKLNLRGYGDNRERKKHPYGSKEGIRDFKRDRYRDLELKQSVKQALRRGHDKVLVDDLKVYEREKKGKIEIVYCLDASGSMKGGKIGTAKKAGIALAYKAVQERNKVGLIVFGSEIKKEMAPSQDFKRIIEELSSIRAGMETDLANTILKAIELFSNSKVTKHLTLITDALPTKGKSPVKDTLKAASAARENGITISVLGINLEKDGLDLAKRIVEIGNGRLYKIKDLEEMDGMVLEDYYSL